MRTSDVMNLINDVELRFPVDQWKVGGLKVWPLLRFEIYFRNADHFNVRGLNTAPALARRLKFGRDMARYCWAYLRDCARNRRPAGPIEAVFLSKGDTYTKLGQRWFDNFCDPFVDILEREQVSHFLMTPATGYYVPRWSPSMFIQPHLHLASARSRWLSNHHATRGEQLPEYDQFIADLERLDGVVAPDLALLRRQTAAIESHASFFTKLFGKLNPVVGFQACYYLNQGLGFNLACRRWGIPSVDIQHGLQGEFHFAYARWNRVPAEGYALLPSVFWCWSDWEADTIRQWCGRDERHRPVVGGNLLLQYWRERTTSLVDRFHTRIEQLKQASGRSRHVLFTVRGNEDPEMLAVMWKVILDTVDTHHWWIRVHPLMLEQLPAWERICHQHRLQNVNLIDASELPLYALLAHVDMHLTARSTTVVEAQAFGVPSVLIDSEGAQVFADQVASGWATPAYTYDAILAAAGNNRANHAHPESGGQHQFESASGRHALLTLIKQSQAARLRSIGL